MDLFFKHLLFGLVLWLVFFPSLAIGLSGCFAWIFPRLLPSFSLAPTRAVSVDVGSWDRLAVFPFPLFVSSPNFFFLWMAGFF